MKNQWLDCQQIKKIQERKLRKVLNHAYNSVPFYKRLFDEAGITPLDILSIEDLKKIPLTNKSNFQTSGIEFFTSSSYEPKNLKIEHTSGSTGTPFTMYFDRDFIMVRDLMFLRALRTAGYIPGQKLLLITGNSHGKKRRRLFRWSYVSILQSPGTHLKYVNQFKPDVLYGYTTSLKLLARHIQKTGTSIHCPKKVITAAEMLDKPTRKYLEEIFDAELFDFYGLTEMGIVGWECSKHNGYHLAEDSTVIEYMPVNNGDNYQKLIMTNLNLTSMPFIRYATGDIADPGRSRLCGCGRGFALLQKIEGRIVDCIHLKDGQIVSPYKLTCALEKIQDVMGYQVIQNDYDKFTVKVETISSNIESVDEEILKMMHSVLGQEITVDILRNSNITPPPGNKFRVIESELINI